MAVKSERVGPATASEDSCTAMKRTSRPYQDEQDLPILPTSQRVPESSKINLLSVRRELTALAVIEVVHIVNPFSGMQNALDFYTATARVYDKNIMARTLMRCVYASFMDDIDYASLDFFTSRSKRPERFPICAMHARAPNSTGGAASRQCQCN